MDHRSTTQAAEDEAYRALGVLVGLLVVVALFLGAYLLGRSSSSGTASSGVATDQAAVTQAPTSVAAESPADPAVTTLPEDTATELETSSQAQEPAARAPTPEPQPTPTAAEPFPQSAEEAAARFGGDPSEWTRAPDAPNGLVFRTNGSGDWPRFVVPEGCLVHQDGPDLHPGDTVYTSGFTIWFGVSS